MMQRRYKKEQLAKQYDEMVAKTKEAEVEPKVEGKPKLEDKPIKEKKIATKIVYQEASSDDSDDADEVEVVKVKKLSKKKKQLKINSNHKKKSCVS
jgi:hypothetical protein